MLRKYIEAQLTMRFLVNRYRWDFVCAQGLSKMILTLTLAAMQKPETTRPSPHIPKMKYITMMMMIVMRIRMN